jgi:hypothetical protein
MATNREFMTNLRKVLALDEAMAKLQEAGLEVEFVKAIEKDPELLDAINKIAPNLSGAASAGWSCCVTVNNPLRSPGEEVINPVVRRKR